MRKLTTLIILFIAFSGFVRGQKHTVLSVLNGLSKTQNLELSYSSDLVDLDQNIDIRLSNQPDSCIFQIEKLAGLLISKQDGHLVIVPSPTKIIRVQGMVMDSVSKEPLPYASLQIKNTSAGTTTNSEGKFDFKVPARYIGYDIEITYLGYGSVNLKIPRNSAENVKVMLEPKPYTLSDVYVLPMKMQAIDMVKKAVKNIKRNYDRTTAQYDAFYRNTSFRDSLVCQLIEAALLIEDKGINTPSSTTEIKLQQFRKSNNYLIPYEKWREVLYEKLFPSRNMFYRAYSNMVRIYQDDWWYQPLTQYDKFIYEFEGTEWLGDVKVYKVKYIRDTVGPDGKRDSERGLWEDAGYFYINSQDWAILRIEKYFKYATDSSLKKNRRFVELFFKGETEFQKIGEKYYLKYRHFIDMGDGTPFTFLNPDAPDDQKTIKEVQWSDVFLLVTNVITERRDFDKIKYREVMARDENSYRKKYPYDQVFWKNYNILNEKPLRSKYMSDLEAEKKLEQQFVENSSNHDLNP